MDTETHTLVDGEVVPESRVRDMMTETLPDGERKYPVKWWREHVTVVAWAYIVYSPDGFAILESWDEYTRFCAQYRVKHAWWYNAPFDFSILDYDKLSRGWKYIPKPKSAGEFGELCSEFGARYTMTEVHTVDAIDGGRRSKKTKQKVVHYDMRNLLKGGLRCLLESFDVKDADGTRIRKREMDYQSAGFSSLTYDDILYMLDDARGLWWLVNTFGERLRSKYNIDILSGKPEVLTASGMAKKLLLRKMYPHASDKGAVTLYRRDHPMTLELDTFFRENHLLQGGLVMLNPAIKGKHLKGVKLYRYDYNSHYPAIMSVMPDITGIPMFYDGYHEKVDGCIRIFVFDAMDAHLKKGYIPAWLNPITGKVDGSVSIYEWRDGCISLFDFEFDELGIWYDILTYNVKRTIIYHTKPGDGIHDFVFEHYKDKQDASTRHDKVGKEIPKLTLNGASGKFSQNPNHAETFRVMTEDGHVTLESGEVTADEASIMNVVQGSYITAMGRTKLRQSCREIAAENGRTVAETVLYTDTDSVHTNTLFTGTDALKLGYLKCENETPIFEAIFVAPKAYAERDERGTEYHSKGVNIECLREAEKQGDSLPDIYRPGRRYLSLSALNVRGGKALLPLPKCIKRNLEDIDEYGEELFF